MLFGIGGRTIAEAKQNLSLDEFESWAAYIRAYGPLNINRHLERGFALIAMQINRGLGGKAEMMDYMPYAKRNKGKKAITLKEAMETWK